MPLHNRYDALGLENADRVSNRQDPGKANHAKLVQPPTRIRTSAPRKAGRVLVIGDFFLRGLKHLFGIDTASLQKLACWELASVVSQRGC